MDKKFLNQLKSRLQSRRDYLLKEIEQRLKEFKDSGGHRLTDTADIASSIMEEEITMYAAQGEAKEIEQIDIALKRLNNGKYGICVSCGKKINKERLKAIPFVNLCIRCKEAEERKGEQEEQQEQNKGYYRLETERHSSLEEDEDESTMRKKQVNDINPYQN